MAQPLKDSFTHLSAFVRVYERVLRIQTQEPDEARFRDEAFRMRQPSVGVY